MADEHKQEEMEEEEEKNKLYRLSDMKTQFVSLVTAGANRQRSFMVVKADNQISKAVPPMDASNDVKRKSAETRAGQYGIELRSDASLSYPAGSPTTESMYGDPVNLKYPFGGPNNQVDIDRVRNALARFKQAYGEYNEQGSQNAVWERIVERAVNSGVKVSYDPNDRLDASLPASLKDKLEKIDDQPEDEKVDEDETKQTEEKIDYTKWFENVLETVGVRLGKKLAENAYQNLIELDIVDAKEIEKFQIEPQTDSQKETEVEKEEVVSLKEQLAKSAEVLEALEAESKELKEKVDNIQLENDALRKTLSLKEEEIKKATVKATTLRKSIIGATSSIPVGEANNEASSKNIDNVSLAFRSGGDIAAAIAKNKKRRR